MARITVIGGTGYAGSAIVEQAAARGHQVTALSKGAPKAPVETVTYVQGNASEALGRYQLGDDVAVEPETGGVIAVDDYALGMVDLIDNRAHHRAHVNLGNPV